MPTLSVTQITDEGTPAALFRNAIDLNRYSNSVSRRIINEYNNIIVDATNQLKILEGSDSYKALRLRSIIAQVKESLATWAGDATEITASNLQGLAILQTEFIEEQLKKSLPKAARSIVRTVEVSPQFAKSVVTTDPTQLNLITLQQDLFKSVTGAPETYSLTAGQGAIITLPDGRTVLKAFQGITTASADLLAKEVRTGLLQGQTTDEIVRKLKGRLLFNQKGSVKQIAKAGGSLTAATNRQVTAIVRTSVNQVSNAASQNVYKSNSDITQKYRYVATLDSRTSSICASLDGQVFEYGDGPLPPQHFNCRSTTVAVVDYEGLKKQGYDFEPPRVGRRSASGGMVPSNMTYGQWLKDTPAGKSAQLDVFGSPNRVKYFNKISKNGGPQAALQKMIRDDGSELTLSQLQRRYGKV